MSPTVITYQDLKKGKVSFVLQAYKLRLHFNNSQNHFHPHSAEQTLLFPYFLSFSLWSLENGFVHR